MTGPVRLVDHTVVVDDGTITAVGPREAVDITGAEIIDGRGRFLIPGLVDAHVHLRDFRDTALFLAAGVTRVRHMSGAPEHLAYARLVEQAKWAGPRLSSSSTFIDGRLPDGPSMPGAIIISDPAHANALVSSLHTTGYEQLKAYSGLSPDVHAALGSASSAYDMPLGGHCPASLTYEQAIAHGQTSFEHLASLGRDRLDRAGNETYQRIAKAGYAEFNPEILKVLIEELDLASVRRLAQQMADQSVWNCPTLVINDLVLGTPDDFAETPGLHAVSPSWLGLWNVMTSVPGRDELAELRPRIRDTYRQVTSILHEAGAPLLVGTDTGVVPGFSVALELVNFVAAGISTYDALRYATTEPARFLDLPAGTGTIQPGQDADLVLLEADPLASISAVRRVSAVLVNGWYLDKAALDEVLASVAAAHLAPVATELPLPPVPSGAQVVSSGQLASRLFGAPAGALAYRCCSLPDGQQLLDEVETLLDCTIERRVRLTADGALCSADTTRHTPVGSHSRTIAVNGEILVRTDDHGMVEHVTLTADAPVLAGPGVAVTANALGKHLHGTALTIGHEGPRIKDVTLRREANQIEATYTPPGEAAPDVPDPWRQPESLIADGSQIIGGMGPAEALPWTRQLSPMEAEQL